MVKTLVPAAASLLFITSPARAGDAMEISLHGGYALNDSNAGSGDAMNIYGPGVGLRAGYIFPFRAYAGASWTWHGGFSRDLGGGASGSGRVAPLGVELGYDFRAGALRVRPYLGIGVALYRSSYHGGGTFIEGSGTKAALWPGALASWDLSPRLFAGLDLRYTAVLAGADADIVAAGGGSANAFGAYALFGVRIG